MSTSVVPGTRRTQVRHGLLWLALALWIVSLILPAVSNSTNPRMVLDCSNPTWAEGWFLFLFGPLGIMAGQFGWLANPLMLFAAFKTRVEIAAIAVGLGVLTAFTFTSIPNDIAANRVCSFGAGFYLWLASTVAVLVATFVKPVRKAASN
jgi:hypothetical protein